MNVVENVNVDALQIARAGEVCYSPNAIFPVPIGALSW